MGLGKANEGGSKTFLTINDGNIKQAAKEDTPGAVKREWEAKDGTKGEKWELSYPNVSGNIVGLNYKDGDFGTSLMVDIQDGSEIYSLQISTKSRYYDDLAKKIKSIDLEKPVELAPYNFEGDNAKRFTGVSVKQGGEKVMNYYYDGKKSINKMPKVDEDELKDMGKDYWTIYFVKVGSFLKKEIEGIKVPEAKVVEKSVDIDEDEAQPLPF